MALSSLRSQLKTAAWGKEEVVEKLLVALISEGHLLVEDVPGVGKTTLVRALAQSLGAEHRRLQFTPDLLPSDVTGFTFYDAKAQAFQFRPGPVFTNLLLADEINRTSPKTQSSLLEAMEEGQVTVDGQVYPLPRPFMVVATQNPVEYEGTFPLPEAQLDRFLLRIRIGYPDPQQERAVLSLEGDRQTVLNFSPVADPAEVQAATVDARKVTVSEPVADYALRVAAATRNHRALRLGVSPRGAILWVRAARALAYLRGDTYVAPDHLRELAKDALAHRLLVRASEATRGLSQESLLEEVMGGVPLPGATRRAAP